MIERASRSVAIAFIASGLSLASFLSRVPQIRDLLGLTPGRLGRVLLMLAIGSIVSLPMSGMVVRKFGTRRTVSVMAIVVVTGIAVAGVGSEISPTTVGAGLFLTGFGMGLWDVAMNVEAAAIERRLDRSIMSRYHAAFSLGTVAGALIGAGANKLSIRPAVHLVSVMAIAAVTTTIASRNFLGEADHSESSSHVGRHPLRAWTEPRTLLIGLFVLCMAFAEGTGNDWLSVGVIDGYEASAATGSIAYVVFVASMTIGRWFGPQVLSRFGRVTVLRACAASALIGVLIVVISPSVVIAFGGIMLWGLGASLGFPTGMSAAADDPVVAASRVSVVATIGYLAFLAGPSLIGAIGDHTGVRKAFTLTAAILGVGFGVAAATRPLQSSGTTGDRSSTESRLLPAQPIG